MLGRDVQCTQHIQGTDIQTIYREQMSRPCTHREQVSRPLTCREQMYRPHKGTDIHYTDNTLEHDKQTTHWNRYTLYRPHTGNRYADHRVRTDIQTTHREQICRPQSENRYTDHTPGADMQTTE
jgi:hypothetical protein